MGISGAVLAAACARPPPPHTPSTPVIWAEPVVVTPAVDLSPTEQFERAFTLLEQQKYLPSALAFDILIDSGPDASMVPAALFDAGLAWEGAGERERALERYRAVLARYPTSDPVRAAASRALRLHAYLEQWSELSGVADVLLLQTGLSPIDRLAALGAKALALAESGDAESAGRFVGKGRDIIEELRLGEGGTLPIEVAQIDFALGEVRKQRSEKITFLPLPKNFAATLELRCQGLLDAQSAYMDAMRSNDAHWAGMSGYRVGELYQQLHLDVLAVPFPKAVDTAEKKLLFLSAMRLRYRVLLEKGLQMMEHTVMLGDRTGEASPWIERARQAKEQLARALDDEKSALTRLPYTEKELADALADLSRKALAAREGH